MTVSLLVAFYLGGMLATLGYVLCELKRGIFGTTRDVADAHPGKFATLLLFGILAWPASLLLIYRSSAEQ